MFSIFLTALGLSMDACAASIALSAKHKLSAKLIFAAFCFALFQAAMPILGYLLGLPFEQWIAAVDHWIAFLILGGLGLNMIVDFKEADAPEEQSGFLSVKMIVSLAIATSIDAFVVGIGFHALGWDLLTSIAIIGGVTLGMSLLGLGVGHFSKNKLSSHAEKLGGLILIFLGFKILITHLSG